MHLPISISCDRGRGKKTVETKALVNSGAGGTFIDQNFARTKGFCLQNLEHPITVYNVDGTLNKRGTIVHFVETNVKIGERTQEIQFLVSGLGHQKIILGFPWLEKENPVIDWKKATLDWPPEERIRKPKYRLQSQNHKHTSRPIIEEIYDDDDQFNSPVNPISNDEPNLILPINEEPCSGDSCPQINATFTASAQFAQKEKKPTIPAAELVPPEFHEFLPLFDKKASERFPESRSWDHKIELKEGFIPKAFKKYNLTPAEQRELNCFIDDNLEKGYIRPSQSPMASPFFFVGKKDVNFRPCQDYQYLNDGTIKNAYPLPLISELMDLL